MRTYRIGIDLATINTGLCIIDENDIVVYTETINLKRFTNKNLKENVREFIHLIPLQYLYSSKMYIELSKYSMRTAQMFSIYAGIIYSSYYDKYDIKFIDPNKWQTEFCKKYEIRKLIQGSSAKKGEAGFHKNTTHYFYPKKMKWYGNIKEVLKDIYIEEQGNCMKDKSQDEIDAYFIAILGEQTKGEF